MTHIGFSSFSTAIDELAVSGVLVGQRLILPGDEAALLLEEASAFEGSVVAARRASGAARLVARNLLKRLGYPVCPIKRGSARAPTWPEGIRGSMAGAGRLPSKYCVIAAETADIAGMLVNAVVSFGKFCFPSWDDGSNLSPCG